MTACGGAAVAPTVVESPTTTDSCTTDPFGDGCDTPAAKTAQDIKITECLAGEAAATPTCESAVKANSCLTNPFNTECENNADFAKYLTPARTARTTLCTSNPFNGLCTADPVARLAFCRDTSKTHTDKATNCAGSLIETACLANPFDALCTGAFLVNDTDRLAFCRDTSKNPSGKVTNCAGSLITDACIANPFDTLCVGTFEVNDTDKLAFCRDSGRTPEGKADDCSGQLITDACVADPFDTLCVGTFLVNDTDRLAFCRDTSKNPSGKVTNCAGSLITDACIANPFDTLCVGTFLVNDTDKLAFCRDTTKTTTTKDSDCTGTITTACTANPFAKTTGTVASLCTGSDTPTDDDRLAFCRDTTKTTTTKDSDCTGTITTACTANPFAKTTGTVASLCTGSDTPTDDDRLAFCRDTTKTTTTKDSDCTGTITTACTANPFAKTTGTTEGNLCDDTYDTARETECRRSTRTIITGDCTATVMSLCNNNPFAQTTGTIGDLCIDTSGTAYADARMKHCADHTIINKNPACADKNDGTGIVQTYCNGRSAADDIYGICDSTNGKEFTAWRGNDDSSPVIGAGSASSGDDPANLIAGGANALYLGNGITAINTTTLYLADGNTTDGIAIASADFGGELQSYAGLLSGSDLGGPIASGTTGTANWTGGKIAIGWHDGTGITTLSNTDFTLEVNFTDGELTASDVAVGASTLDIEGTFDVGSTAVSGTTTLTTNSNGVEATIRGVIGAEGVLAVFATNDTVTSGFYAGGFVAASLMARLAYQRRIVLSIRLRHSIVPLVKKIRIVVFLAMSFNRIAMTQT